MKEAEIRPQDLFKQYLALAREDAETFFDFGRFVNVACPACGSVPSRPAFEKYGFQYVVCDHCGSLYNSPRPTPEMFEDYYKKGKAVEFWGSDFYRVTAESRREKMFRPRAELIAQLVKDQGGAARGTFLDIGSGYGIFGEEMRRLGCFEQVVGVEPSPGLAEICRGKGFEVIEKYAEDLSAEDADCRVAAAFEVLEHVFDPYTFLSGVRRVLKENGLLVFTTLTISGFDLQVLWQESNSIHPPHHINLLSVEGLQAVVERSGFELVELSTPGKLDIDIVSNALKDNPDLQLPGFVSYLLHHRGEKTRTEFQQFLQNHCLSSHVRVIARKRMVA
ncbi:MAG: class I SAM-dependent methyltransferase [bacterium]|nr:class I SAM-dependent methyltransferase [bacterium]